MTVDERPDALRGALAALASPPPDAARDAGIRARCHEVMARRPPSRASWSPLRLSLWPRVWRSWPRVFRPASASIVDTLLVAAVGVYGIVLVAEAFQAAGLF